MSPYAEESGRGRAPNIPRRKCTVLQRRVAEREWDMVFREEQAWIYRRERGTARKHNVQRRTCMIMQNRERNSVGDVMLNEGNAWLCRREREHAW
jgi:hypothetical protein